MAGDNNEKLEETTPTVNINPFQMQAMIVEITKQVQNNLIKRNEEANDFFYGTRQPRNRAVDRHARRTRGEAIERMISDDAYSFSGRSDVRSRRSYNPRVRAD
ncbi:hypothetical protein Bca4012_093121 [Brassica carinata]|uniref:Uncharacterized protein n=1 Tax=Brassica carinata TaxID=52824 RepID=A0A8X7PS64_BRACI|nr:hypothetical protein Bca52824_075352 [Brassica carinata]